MTRDGLYRQAGSPYWWASFTDAAGKRRRRSTRCENKKDAERVRSAWIVEAGRGPAVPSPALVTWQELVDYLEADYVRKGNRSWDRAQRAIDKLADVFGKMRAVEITAERLHEYDDHRIREGASPASRQYELRILHRVFTVAVDRERLAIIPTFPKIKVNNAREEYITDDDLAALQIELPEYLRGLAVFRSLTGMRKGEVLGLRWSQVDWKAGVLRLRRGTTKSGEPRTFPFHNYPALRAVLEAQRAYTDHWERLRGPDVPLVFHRRGKPIKSYDNAWRAACRRAGVLGADGRPKVMHDFRRTAARRMEQAGVPRSLAMRLTGHKTESVFKRYAVVSEGDLDAATERLAATSENRHSGEKGDPEKAQCPRWESNPHAVAGTGF